MIRLALPFGIAVILAGCSGHNLSPHTLQFSGDTLPVPANYEREAARIVRDRGAEPATVRVSEPQTTLGVTAFSPKRWYVCVKGIPAPQGKPQGPLPIDETVGGWLTPGSDDASYDVLLIFSGAPTPSVREGYDSPLCRNLNYHAITASPPPA